MKGIYSNKYREELIEDDEITMEEYFFMQGYELNEDIEWAIVLQLLFI